VTDHKKNLDAILADIATAKAGLAAVEAGYDADVAAIKARWAPTLDARKSAVTDAEKRLTAYAAAHREAIFAAGDRVHCRRGDVILATDTRVVRKKTITWRLVELVLGSRAVKRPDPVIDWDAVDQATDEELARLETERRNRQSIEYDLGPDA
jgi:hypothetical protein